MMKKIVVEAKDSEMKRLSCIFVSTISLIVNIASSLVADEPPQLTAARAEYEKELEKVQRPVREKYLRTLQDLKKDLAAKGNTDSAKLIQQEIDGLIVKSTLRQLAGDWEVKYGGGAIRHYSITKEGDVFFTDYDPPKRAIVKQFGNVYVLDFGDDKLERLTRTPFGFAIEHFSPASKLSRGEAGTPAEGRRVK